MAYVFKMTESTCIVNNVLEQQIFNTTNIDVANVVSFLFDMHMQTENF